MFNKVDLGGNGFAAVVGLTDGILRGVSGPATVDQDVTIRETPLFDVIRKADSGLWTGRSPIDAVIRIHAFRKLQNQDLTVIAGMDEEQALAPAAAWEVRSSVIAACVTALLLAAAWLAVLQLRSAQRRDIEAARSKADLAAAKAQLEVADANGLSKSEQLEATLAGMADGLSVIDRQMCLVEWNERFPDLAGVPAGILRVGLPMEEIIRAQIASGQFGRVDNVEAEISRRMAGLRSGSHSAVQRQRPDGRTIELRRRATPDGGFITIYSDITDQKHAEEALRHARASVEQITAAQARFVGLVNEEIRRPLKALIGTLGNLADSALPLRQQVDFAAARQSGAALVEVVDNILDVARIDSGTLAIRPTLLQLRTLIDATVAAFAREAADRGLSIQVSVAGSAPQTLYADPERFGQILRRLLADALQAAAGPEILLEANRGRNAAEGVLITVRYSGPVMQADERSRLFLPLSETASETADLRPALARSICLELANLMGGQIGCEPWNSAGGQAGNALWLMLPAAVLLVRPPAESVTSSGLPPEDPDAEPRPRLPRTRVLLVEDLRANQIVTATLLRREGHMVDIVADGSAAIDAVMRVPYDLVFMDIFMPGMGGRETAAAIRALPEPARSVPILALTAAASADDEARARQVGMNGILSKPVSRTELLDAISAQVWSRDPRADPDTQALIPAELSRVHPTLSAERILELRSNLPPQTFVNLVEECLVDLEQRTPALRRAITAGSLGAVTAHAHAMVGMAASYGMASLETALRSVMTAAREGDAEALGPDAIKYVESELASVTRALREMMQDVLA